MNKSFEDRYTQITNYILYSLKYGPYRNVHYVARLEYLNNYHNEKYISLVLERTGGDRKELRNNSRLYIMNLKQGIIKKLKSMKFIDMVNMINEKERMNDFLNSINQGIGEVKDDIFLQKRN